MVDQLLQFQGPGVSHNYLGHFIHSFSHCHIMLLTPVVISFCDESERLLWNGHIQQGKRVLIK